MRILFITPRPPAPPLGGDRLRLHRLVRYLGARHEVTLFTLARTDADVRAADGLRDSVQQIEVFRTQRPSRLWRAVTALPGAPLQVGYFWSPELKQAVSRLSADSHHVAFGSLIRTADYLLDAPFPTVIDVQDSISMHYRMAIPLLSDPYRALYRLELPRVERYEHKVFRRAAAATLVSPVDLADARRRAPDARLELVGNGVDLPTASDTPPVEDRILFLGNLRTVSNRDMVTHFVREVLPQIRSKRPAAHLQVVGIHCPRSIRAMEGEAVSVVGEVDDPLPFLRSAWITVCPMRFGAGVPNKVLESIAAGTPAVITPIAGDALGLVDGDGVRIARGAAELTRACVDLLSDATTREALGEAGRRIARERFQWERALQPLDDLLAEVAGR